MNVQDSEMRNNFNIYTIIDITLKYWIYILSIPIISVILTLIYLILFPQPSSATFTLTINNDDIEYKSYNTLYEVEYIPNILSEQKNNSNKEETISHFTKLIYSTLRSNKFLKEIVTKTSFLNSKVSLFDENNFGDYTSIFMIGVSKDLNANINNIDINMILPLSDSQMREIGSKIFKNLDLAINSKISIFINDKIRELDLIYNMSKFEIDAGIEEVEKEIFILEERLNDGDYDEDLPEFTNRILEKKQFYNSLLIKLIELDNFYKINKDILEDSNNKLKNGFYNIDRENIKYNYDLYKRPYDLYILLVVFISLFLSILLFILIEGYKKNKKY